MVILLDIDIMEGTPVVVVGAPMSALLEKTQQSGYLRSSANIIREVVDLACNRPALVLSHEDRHGCHEAITFDPVQLAKLQDIHESRLIDWA